MSMPRDAQSAKADPISIGNYVPRLRSTLTIQPVEHGAVIEDTESTRKVFVESARLNLIHSFFAGELTLRHYLAAADSPREFTPSSLALRAPTGNADGAAPSHRLRGILALLKRLDDAHFLVNRLPLADVRQIATLSSPFFAKRNYLDRKLLSVVRTGPLNGPLKNSAIATFFFVATLILGVWALVNWSTLEPSNLFYNPDTGHSYAVGKTILALSIFFSASALWSGLASLLTTGKVAFAEIAVYPLAFGLRMGESFGVASRLQILGSLAKALVYLAVWVVVSAVLRLPQQFIHDMGVIAVLATFSLTNPYRESLVTAWIERSVDPDKLRHLWPYLRSRSLFSFVGGGKVAGEKFLLLYSSVAVAWSMLFINFAVDYFSRDWPVLVNALATGSLLGRANAAFVVLLYVFIFISGLGPIALIVFNNLLFPFLGGLYLLLRKVAFAFGAKSNLWGTEALAAVSTAPLFAGFSNEVLRPLLEQARQLELPAGVPLLVQNDEAREFYFLIEGSIEVSRRETSGLRQSLARLQSPLLFGETALSQSSRRQADVTTTSRCKLLLLDGANAKTLWFEQLSSELKTKFFNRILLQQFLGTASAFHGFPVELASVLENLGHIREVQAGEVLIHEGATEDVFYLLLRGQAQVSIGANLKERIGQGGFFGEIAVLQSGPRTATVTMIENGSVFELRRDQFWDFVAQYPMLGVEIEEIAERRLAAAGAGR